jgi:hypothetical protein
MSETGITASPPPPEPDRPSDLASEMAHIPDEPLLPIEKQLIAGSLLLGVVLLGVLLWISHMWF